MSCASRRSPRTTRRGCSKPRWDRNPSPGSAARHCMRSGSRSRASTRSAARLANTISPANTSRCPHRKAAAWSRPGVPQLCSERAAREVRSRRAELGHCQQGLRAQRFQRLHQLGHQGQKPLPAARIAQADGISRAEARSVRAMRGLRSQCRADRGQGLGDTHDGPRPSCVSRTSWKCP